jgi:uroporphyrinogen decarboxylase
MRQAGRALPEYRKLKESHTFVELVQNPELAAEVTLQPIRRFGFDAAILFSDILVIPEAMGQAYHFRETGGVRMEFAVRSRADVDRLSVAHVCERLHYVEQALRLLRRELGDQTALIGFSGSPWTLATFMMEGGSAKESTRALELSRSDPRTFHALMEKLTAAVTDYLRMQVRCGVDALQIFDSHGGILPPAEFNEASGRWMKEVISGVKNPNAVRSNNERGQASERPSDHRHPAVPVIVFSLGTHGNWPDLIGTGAEVLGVDWQSSLTAVRRVVPEGIGLQGNLPPALLSDATPEAMAGETRRVLEEMRGRPGHIFNLGHGTPPTTKLENMAALVETVKGFVA